jgi:hypothetical protein
MVAMGAVPRPGQALSQLEFNHLRSEPPVHLGQAVQQSGQFGFIVLIHEGPPSLAY